MDYYPILHVILHCPKIPQNTGNIGRMCAVLGARLHLVHPLGFTITDAKLKRSGMDYWKSLDVVHHADWEAFKRSPLAPPTGRIWLFTTKSQTCFWDAKFERGDGLLFGSEDCGCPESVHADICERRVKIPHLADSLRSLNLSTSAGIAAYEAARRILSSEGAKLECGKNFF